MYNDKGANYENMHVCVAYVVVTNNHLSSQHGLDTLYLGLLRMTPVWHNCEW